MRLFFTMVLASLALMAAAQTSLDTSLILYYPFNGNLDDSTQSHGAVATKGDTSYGMGRKGSALLFDGTNPNNPAASYADVPSVPFDSMSAFTISLWAKPGNISSDGEGLFFAGNHHAGWLGIGVFWNSLRFSVGSGLSIGDKPLAFPYQSRYKNQWNLYTLCFEQDTMYAYVNDSLLGKRAQKVLLGSAEAMLATHQFGLPVADQVRSQRFTGALDELRIYNKCLSKSEIRDLYDITYTNRVQRLEAHGASQLRVYPNPSQGPLYFRVDYLEGPSQVKVMSHAGQVIIEQPASPGLQELDLSGYPAGIYLIQVSSPGSIQGGKAILKP